MYKVYGKASTRAFRVLWMLEEIGEPYELVEVGPHDPQVYAVNPSGKVPVLGVGDDAVSDSSAILTYLADRHGKLTYPAGTIERAHQDALIHAVLDELDSVLWVATRHSFILPEEQRVAEIPSAMKWEFERNIKTLAKRFKGPFLMGEEMTIADIICVHCLNWGFGIKFPVEDDALLAYGKRMRARPAFQKVAAMRQP
ncbi:glutathione S-transferase family protein [Seohaeicola saemankumensis]|nr:glutathione S-transferase family protein [Seohaeicola saemankumensis]MCA0872659.1 glutathione S-transferase family protein [Seohaeicola saemankumensis]